MITLLCFDPNLFTLKYSPDLDGDKLYPIQRPRTRLCLILLAPVTCFNRRFIGRWKIAKADTSKIYRHHNGEGDAIYNEHDTIHGAGQHEPLALSCVQSQIRGQQRSAAVIGNLRWFHFGVIRSVIIRRAVLFSGHLVAEECFKKWQIIPRENLSASLPAGKSGPGIKLCPTFRAAIVKSNKEWLAVRASAGLQWRPCWESRRWLSAPWSDCKMTLSNRENDQTPVIDGPISSSFYRS